MYVYHVLIMCFICGAIEIGSAAGSGSFPTVCQGARPLLTKLLKSVIDSDCQSSMQKASSLFVLIYSVLKSNNSRMNLSIFQ